MDVSAGDLKRELARLEGSLEEADLADALFPLADVLREGFGRNFSQAVGPDGSPWPPRKDDKPHPLLDESGALKGAATGGPGSVLDVQSRELAVGVDKGVPSGGLPGAAVHQFGYGNIPARPYLHASEETLDEAVELFADGALQAIFGE